MTSLLLLPGDGIGPEVTAESRRILDVLALPGLTISEGLFGGASIDVHDVPLTDATQAAALASTAVLMGAVGGPQWADVSYDRRPEAGLLKLRGAMNVFANLRPARCFAALASASTLKPEVVDGLDILFVRELVLELRAQGLIDDEFLDRLVARVEKVLAGQSALPEAQVDLIRLSIDEMRDNIRNP
jgi:3-isopropylmalate dehydrogenase